MNRTDHPQQRYEQEIDTMGKSHLPALKIAAALLVAGLAGAEPALAQEQQAEDIIVTAQRRAQSIQDIPVSITAFSGETLRQSVITDSFALQFNTPGLVLSTNKSLGQPFIRGIGTDILTVGADSSVATNLDGVYQTRPTAAIQEFFDVARVEVVKGPQGTLYGRNATGGAINVITNRPGQELEAFADLTVGNYATRRLEAAINLPLSDISAVRIAGVRTTRSGFSRDLALDRDLDDADLWAVRAQLLIQPTDRFTIELRGYLTREDSARTLAGTVNPNAFAPAVNIFGATLLPNPREVRLNHPNNNKIRDDQLHLELQYKFDGFELKSLTSWDRRTLQELVDIDSTDVDFAWDTDDQESKVLTQELQLLSRDTERLDWVLGAYFLTEDADQRFIVYVPPIQGIIDPQANIQTDAYAVFGEGTYKLTDALSVTAGLRYSIETKEQRLITTITDPVGGLGTPGGVFVTERGGKETWRAFTPKLGLEYRTGTDALIYATISRGFKSGGFNTAGAGEMFDPEFIWSYETGVKTSLLNNQVRLNMSAFYYDYTNLQVNRFEPQTGGAVSTVTNAAEATLAGADLELFANLGKAFDADLRVSLLHAQYDSFLTSDPDSSDPDALQDLSGNRLPRAPRFSSVLGLGWKVPLGSNELRLRGEWSYQSQIYFNQFNADLVSQDGYHLINVSVALNGPDDRWRLAAFVRNLTDETFRTTVIRSTSFIGTLDFFGPPRTWGIQASYRF